MNIQCFPKYTELRYVIIIICLCNHEYAFCCWQLLIANILLEIFYTQHVIIKLNLIIVCLDLTPCIFPRRSDDTCKWVFCISMEIWIWIVYFVGNLYAFSFH